MKYAPSQVRKTLLSALGFAAVVLSTILAVGPDLIPDSYLPWVNVVIALATIYGVFRVPNQPADGEAPDPDVSEQGYTLVETVTAVVLAAVLVSLFITLLSAAAH